MKKFSLVKDDPYKEEVIDLEAEDESSALYEALNKVGYILIEEEVPHK
jgi:hypothetical protein